MSLVLLALQLVTWMFSAGLLIDSFGIESTVVKVVVYGVTGLASGMLFSFVAIKLGIFKSNGEVASPHERTQPLVSRLIFEALFHIGGSVAISYCLIQFIQSEASKAGVLPSLLCAAPGILLVYRAGVALLNPTSYWGRERSENGQNPGVLPEAPITYTASRGIVGITLLYLAAVLWP